LLTVAWYLMFVNAINRFDGVYGLASWLSSIGFFTIVLLIELVVFTQYPDMLPERAILLTWVSRMWMLLGSLSLIALVMEWKPFGLMRDVGTMFLWFSLAYLALLGWAKIWIMIVVLALPLFDAIWVIIDRLHRRKKHPFKWDYSHLHYRLLALWRNRNEVRVVLLGLSLCMLILMLLLDDDRMAKVIVFALVALVFFGVNGYMYRIKWLEVEYTPKK
jgi:UDP-N-acetylmuramyl pentapeptide phosphotransferase/UDP-N-acetylglucosamine-1-phosphate transferase